MTAVANSLNSINSQYNGTTDTGNTVVSLKPDETQDFSTISHISEKMVSPVKSKQENEFTTAKVLNQTMRGNILDQNHVANCQPNVTVRRKNHNSHTIDDSVDSDALGKKVEKVLSKTEHLETENGSLKTSGVDYDILRRDLQDIQDSLHRTSGEESIPCRDHLPRLNFGDRKNSISSEEIIPSTTTTPRTDKMAWDFAAVLGYTHPGGLMNEISLDTYTSNSQRASSRPSTEKYTCNSDGNDTHTSDNSSKLDDHTAADQVLADMSEILHPNHMLQSSTDVDTVLNNFRDQRKQIENRYEEINHQRLSNQNLSEKVYRILTNQDPKSRANEILSDISAEEKDMKTRFALGLRKDDFNFSINPEDSQQMGTLTDDVRRRLDLSGLSVDSSGAISFLEPKGFTAFEDMTKFLTSQMEKITEKTFNHSIELRPPPQSILCYPVFGDNNGAQGGKPAEYKTTSDSVEDGKR